MFKKYTLLLLLQGVFILLFVSPVHSADKTKFIAIIMDDLGSNQVRGEQFINLPAQITYSFLPHTPYAKPLALAAYAQGKEVMLHMPMEPLSDKDMGPGGLSLSMDHGQFSTAIRQAMLAVPHAKGVNNHMGSLLTGSLNKMNWLMRELKASGDYYFVDSRTHKDTVAEQMASSHLLPTASRDIFLDHEIDKQAIDSQFKRLIKQANESGYALAIGHPYYVTLQALSYWITIIEAEGIELVPVSQYIRRINNREDNDAMLQASLSPEIIHIQYKQ